MITERIHDFTDSRLADYRDIRDAKSLRQRHLFVAEGRLVVERVLSDPRYRVHSILVNHAALQALQPALASLPDSANLQALVCDTPAFEALTGYNIHRGCLALVRRPPAARWQDLLANARLVVVLEGVTDADNVGSVFRNAAAFGVDAVLLSPATCDPLYRKAIRTSMGHALRLPFAEMQPWPESVASLSALGFTVVALSPRLPSTALDDFATAHLGERIALLVGTEGAGLTTAVERLADARVRIPVHEHVDSLNLGVATGIALFRLST